MRRNKAATQVAKLDLQNFFENNVISHRIIARTALIFVFVHLNKKRVKESNSRTRNAKLSMRKYWRSEK